MRQQTTGKGTTLPPISGSFGTRGDGRRLSLNRVENVGYLTLSRKTVNLEFLGCIENPTFSEARLRDAASGGGDNGTRALRPQKDAELNVWVALATPITP
jgi:hypothetical protein